MLLLEGFTHGAPAGLPALRPGRRLRRHRRRRAARHRPGADRRAAAADHLQRSTPPAALIMFAGIYYGAMYGGSTTSILLNTPGEVGLDRHGARGQQDGQERPGGRGAGDGGHRLVRRRHHRHGRCSRSCSPAVVELRGQVRPGRLLRADGAGLHDGRARVLGDSRAARPGQPLSSGWPSAWSASTSRPARRASPSASRSCWTASTSCSSRSGLFAVGEALYVASQLRQAGRRDRSRSRARSWMTARGLEALLEAVAARHRHRLPDRHASRRAAPRSRRSCPTPIEKKLAKHQARSSARARSKASPARKRPTTPRPPACWSRC